MTRFFKILLLGGLPLLALPAAALADPLSRYNWTGTYVGGNLDFQRGVPIGAGLISLHAGADRDMGTMVVGGEFEISNADAGAPGGMIDWMTRAKLRVGVPTGRALFYATVGGVRSDSNTGADYGVLAGAGIEYNVVGRWTLGGEVLTHHFPDFNGQGSHNVQSVSARVSYRF
ncbi:outer membrane protein [Pseudooceanicola sp.]|uniref:outer membrane protein n=1 Tax=Pseudooceanicola sp. TaxID=1914328 RepID=UPI004058935D